MHAASCSPVVAIVPHARWRPLVVRPRPIVLRARPTPSTRAPHHDDEDRGHPVTRGAAARSSLLRTSGERSRGDLHLAPHLWLLRCLAALGGSRLRGFGGGREAGELLRVQVPLGREGARVVRRGARGRCRARLPGARRAAGAWRGRPAARRAPGGRRGDRGLPGLDLRGRRTTGRRALLAGRLGPAARAGARGHQLRRGVVAGMLLRAPEACDLVSPGLRAPLAHSDAPQQRAPFS